MKNAPYLSEIIIEIMPLLRRQPLDLAVSTLEAQHRLYQTHRGEAEMRRLHLPALLEYEQARL